MQAQLINNGLHVWREKVGQKRCSSRSMGSWDLVAVALTRSRLEGSLSYGRMTQGC